MPRQSTGTDVDGRLQKLGTAIRRARLERGMSQEALADAAGIDRSHMGKIERGERNVTLLNIARVAEAVAMSIAELMASAEL